MRRLTLSIVLVLPSIALAADPPSAQVTTLPRPSASGGTVRPLTLPSDFVTSGPTIQPLQLPGETIPAPRRLVPESPWTAPPEFMPEPGSAIERGLWNPRSRGVSATPAELAVLFPDLCQRLFAPVTVGTLYTVGAELPSARLHFAATALFNLRFNLGDIGEFGVAYRLLASEGDGLVTGVDPVGLAILRTRLDMHVIDLNYYASQDVGLWWWAGRAIPDDRDLYEAPRWNVRWDMGTRLASVFFDSRAMGPTVHRRVSNHYFGAGPRVGLSLTRRLGDWNLRLFGRVDASALMGYVNQQFSESVVLGNVPLGYGYTSQGVGQGVPTLTAQLGLTNAVPFTRLGIWQIGYQYEQWWMVANAGASTGNLLLQGLFARWMLQY